MLINSKMPKKYINVSIDLIIKYRSGSIAILNNSANFFINSINPIIQSNFFTNSINPNIQANSLLLSLILLFVIKYSVKNLFISSNGSNISRHNAHCGNGGLRAK